MLQLFFKDSNVIYRQVITRYECQDISSIWSDECKFNYFLTLEKAVLETLSTNKVIPISVDEIQSAFKKVVINIERIQQLEQKTHHDVVAFCDSIIEQLPPHIGRFFHYGLTSSDIIDSALSLQLKEYSAIFDRELFNVRAELLTLSLRCEEILGIGRSHGKNAEPLIYASKWLGHYAEFSRRHDEFKNFFEKHLTVKFTGAVGNYTVLTPFLEEEIATLIEMPVEPISTQVIARDHLATFFSLGAALANAIERLSLEIRLLSQSHLEEVSESFQSGQRGSSTMPHKKNPIASENLTGISRVLRSHSQVAAENTLLWYERDISHSSSERMIIPDHTGLMIYSLRRLQKLIKNLDLNKNKIEQTAKEDFAVYSSYFLHLILSQTELTRDEIYQTLQTLSHGKSLSLDEGIKFLTEKFPEVKFYSFDHLRGKYRDHFFTLKKRVLAQYPLEELK